MILHKIVVLVILFSVFINAEVPRPKGVAISMANFYKEGPIFRCIDGSKEIPAGWVNDDYCDCPDGTDEPGTSACPNGKFHCTNAGHSPQNIGSNLVNDGICDCCDGTDEYDGIIQCGNTCLELGKQAREELTKLKQVQEQGYKTKIQYIELGKKTQQEKEERMKTLDVDRLEVEVQRSQLEDKKNEKELPEKEAIDKHNQAKEDARKLKEEEENKAKAMAAFQELDTNNDQHVDPLELVVHTEFDVDSNGVVSDEEAKEYLEDNDKVDFELFYDKIWPNIKEIFKTLVPEETGSQEPEEVPGTTDHHGDEGTAVPPTVVPPTVVSEQRKQFTKGQMIFPPGFKSQQEQVVAPPLPDTDTDPGDEDAPPFQHTPPEDDDDEYHYEEGDYEDADDGDDDDDDDDDGGHDNKKEDEQPTSEYDELTQKLIQEADDARTQFNEADNKIKAIDKEITDLKSVLEMDFGPENEFLPLYGQCFEMTDREYTYKLCPFDKGSQRSKSGGSETSLGVWGHWDATELDKYSVQKYEKGQNCWNGPDRSIRVHLHCGPENQLTGASEPNRCEYRFDFSTPARCSKPENVEGTLPIHEEL